MKCFVETKHIEELLIMIETNQLDLQPDFQRGNVWKPSKKQRLIDTILRNWIIPPIQLIQDQNSGRFIVLDGQQRLQTIYEFSKNVFTIDGSIEPFDKKLTNLDNHFFDDLPYEVRNFFLNFELNVVILTDFVAEEAAELFYRLNQREYLTFAEKRNVYFGQTRNQVKHLCMLLENNGISRERLGFSNSRMAYDDILSKYCFFIEINTLKYRVTSADLSKRYRVDEPFSDETIKIAENSICHLGKLMNYSRSTTNLNKASLFSWLIFLTNKTDDYRETFEAFAQYQQNLKHFIHLKAYDGYSNIEELLILYNKCCSMGSTETHSVITRDACLYIFDCIINKKRTTKEYCLFFEYYERYNTIEYAIDRMISDFNWGERIYEK